MNKEQASLAVRAVVRVAEATRKIGATDHALLAVSFAYATSVAIRLGLTREQFVEYAGELFDVEMRA